MMDKAVIQGTFSDLKTVKTRSVVQMVIEVPIEQGAQIIAAFGFPRPGEEVPVAVARLDVDVAKHAPAPSEKPKERFADKRLSVQAGIRCNDPRFLIFLEETFGDTYNGAADFVRTHCGVSSRKELDINNVAASDWKGLNAEFEQWAGLVPQAR